MKKAFEWDGQKYKEIELPDSASYYSTDMEEKVTCCKCGATIKFGDSYPSRTIHNHQGLGYAECKNCYLEGEE